MVLQSMFKGLQPCKHSKRPERTGLQATCLQPLPLGPALGEPKRNCEPEDPTSTVKYQVRIKSEGERARGIPEGEVLLLFA